MCDPISLETHYSEAMQKAVGLLFITAANVESALGMLVGRCACHPHIVTPQALVAFAGMDLKLKLQTIENCMRLIAPQFRGETEKVSASIRRQFDHRNTIAHNSNFNVAGATRVMPLKMLNKGMRRPSMFTDQQITKYARIMFHRTRQLDELLTRAGVVKLSKSF
jgi:hypothetical protein